MDKENKKIDKKNEPASAQGFGVAKEDIKKELEDCKAKCDEYLNGWKRERADFLNYKKEEMERIGIMLKYANEEMILKLLPVLDDICLAEKHVPDNQKNDACITGFLQIKKQLEEFLKKEGIEHIEVLGKLFDANLMEAVGDVPADAEGSGVAKEEVQRGYTLHGKLIRPAKVKVAK
jgi:molecular chaperone GrpE